MCPFVYLGHDRGEGVPATVRPSSIFLASSRAEADLYIVWFPYRAHKQSLSACVVDNDAGDAVERHFSLDNLRELFLFNDKTVCDTHDSFKCKRCVKGKQTVKAPALLYGDTST